MTRYIKQFILFLCCFGLLQTGRAQEKSDTTTGVIVMTKAHLDSLLTSIAQRKRAQLKKQKQLELKKAKLRAQQAEEAKAKETNTKEKIIYQIPNPPRTTNQVAPTNSNRVLEEITQINKRIDGLVSKMLEQPPKTINNYYPQATDQDSPIIVPIPGRQQPITLYHENSTPPDFQQPSSTKKIIKEKTVQAEQNDTTNSVTTDNKHSAYLRRQVRGLQMQLSALREKNQAETTPKNKETLTALNRRMDTLNARLNAVYQLLNKPQPASPSPKTPSNNSLLGILKNYQQKFYFANNSTSLNSGDQAILDQLVSMIKESHSSITVLVQGYASSSGSAAYNSKISQERAEAVKKALIADGLQPRQIRTLRHGIDHSHTAAQARRAEISLIVD